MWDTPLRAVQSSVNSVSSLRAARWIKRSGKGLAFFVCRNFGAQYTYYSDDFPGRLGRADRKGLC